MQISKSHARACVRLYIDEYWPCGWNTDTKAKGNASVFDVAPAFTCYCSRCTAAHTLFCEDDSLLGFSWNHWALFTTSFYLWSETVSLLLSKKVFPELVFLEKKKKSFNLHLRDNKKSESQRHLKWIFFFAVCGADWKSTCSYQPFVTPGCCQDT